MRCVLCVLLVLSLPASAIAANRTMSLAQAQAAAEKGDAGAAAAVATTTDRDTCLAECERRGNAKAQCTSACRAGVCHPDAETPYCISK